MTDKFGSFQKAPTIRDVARLSGVSDMTVSRVINDPATVRPDTRKKVEAAMSRLRYHPNVMARGMRTNSTRMIGFVLPDITNSTNAAIAQSAEEILAGEGYRMVLLSTGFDPAREADFLERMPGTTADGLIAAIGDETNPVTQSLIRSSRVPIVVLDRDLPFAADAVLSEHAEAMGQSLQYLIDLGHRHIALVMSPLTMRPGRARVDAFLAFMKRQGLVPDPDLIIAVPQRVEDGRQATLSILKKEPRPTALIVGANQLTFGAMLAVREMGLAIPADLSLIGADDVLATGLFDPPLTVIWRDMSAVGASAARLLLGRLSGEMSADPVSVWIPSEVILRRSCAAPPRVGRRKAKPIRAEASTLRSSAMR